MDKNSALKVIFWLSLAGILFSGFLSYSEIFGQTCSTEKCSAIIGVPACLYGFLMYCIVFAISIFGMKSKK